MTDIDTATGVRTTRPSRSRRRWRLALLLGVVAVVVAVTLLWFQPQRLLFDIVVDDAFPTTSNASVTAEEPVPEVEDDGAADAAPTDEDDDAPGAADGTDEADEADEADGPVALTSGSFTSRHRYTVEGTATVFELEDGARILRFEDFTSTNGPDLRVLLIESGAGDDDTSFGAASFELGPLRGNVGDQNYDIPPDLDLDRYDRVVVWCEPFSRTFGVAELTAG